MTDKETDALNGANTYSAFLGIVSGKGPVYDETGKKYTIWAAHRR
jgi:hypothetical protein